MLDYERILVSRGANYKRQDTSKAIMNEFSLHAAVSRLAQLTHTFSDSALNQPWSWRAHPEGIRFALLGTYHELKELAVYLGRTRAETSLPLSEAQRVLAQHHSAYRDFQAVMLGVDDEMLDQLPEPGEWPLRQILGHIIGAERMFFTLVHYGLSRQQMDPPGALQPPDDEVERVVGPYAEFAATMKTAGIAALLAEYDVLHQRELDEFAGISDEALAGLSLWWEGEPYALGYRIHRFDAHLRQHLVQAEKCLAALDQAPNEAKRLLRLVYQALAEVENQLLGAADLAVERRQRLADQITARAEDAAAVVSYASQLTAAVKAGDAQQVKAVVGQRGSLADAKTDDGLPLLMLALYYGQQEIAAILVDAGARLTIFEASALGRLDIIQREVGKHSAVINWFSRDGFTPLQLACFFGHEACALWLMGQGADVHAVAKNPQGISPIHAAAASGNIAVIRALLAQGADVNARQHNDFTPMHTAADHGSLEMAQLFLEYGAEVSAVTGDGRTAADIAREKGHQALLPLLAS